MLNLRARPTWMRFPPLRKPRKPPANLIPSNKPACPCLARRVADHCSQSAAEGSPTRWALGSAAAAVLGVAFVCLDQNTNKLVLKLAGVRDAKHVVAFHEDQLCDVPDSPVDAKVGATRVMLSPSGEHVDVTCVDAGPSDGRRRAGNGIGWRRLATAGASVRHNSAYLFSSRLRGWFVYSLPAAVAVSQSTRHGKERVRHSRALAGL